MTGVPGASWESIKPDKIFKQYKKLLIDLSVLIGESEEQVKGSHLRPERWLQSWQFEPEASAARSPARRSSSVHLDRPRVQQIGLDGAMPRGVSQCPDSQHFASLEANGSCGCQTSP